MTSANENPKVSEIVIDSDENDDWIRRLPSAESERKIAAQVLEKLEKQSGKKRTNQSESKKKRS